MRDTEGAGEREELQADLRATIGSVPDHHNKAKKERDFWNCFSLPVHTEVLFTLYCK